MSPPDDALLIPDSPEERSALPAASGPHPVRFTSNIVGPILLTADVICLVASVPAALVAYEVLVGEGVVYSVHAFALAVTAASFLLIRSSKRAYRRTLVDLMHEDGDVFVDAVVSSLLASAVV